MVLGSIVRVKNPRYEPSLHCRSSFPGAETYCVLKTSALSGLIPEPNDDPEETAVPANSTPRAPFPVAELYL